jgi:hypothetical protein
MEAIDMPEIIMAIWIIVQNVYLVCKKIFDKKK